MFLIQRWFNYLDEYSVFTIFKTVKAILQQETKLNYSLFVLANLHVFNKKNIDCSPLFLKVKCVMFRDPRLSGLLLQELVVNHTLSTISYRRLSNDNWSYHCIGLVSIQAPVYLLLTLLWCV